MPVQALPAVHNGQVEIAVGSESYGTSTVAVLVKRSYQIVPNQTAERREQDAPFRRVDQYFDDGDPSTSTVEHESELAPLKALTDVVICGQAHAPAGRACQQMFVSVSVANQHKRLLITGDRTCHYVPNANPGFSEPASFVTLPLRYERAYGGKDDQSDSQLPFRYPRNDMGTGFVLDGRKEMIDGLRLPNIEDPDDMLTSERVVVGNPKRWHMQPLPQGLGWRQRTWFPRCSLIGACPAFLDAGTVTAEENLGWLPTDYVALAKQFRLAPNLPLFANGASLGLSFDGLAEGAAVELRGLTPDGTLAFQLPCETPNIGLDLGAGAQALTAKLYTVVIRPDSNSLDMIWGGKCFVGEYARWAAVSNMQPEVS